MNVQRERPVELFQQTTQRPNEPADVGNKPPPGSRAIAEANEFARELERIRPGVDGGQVGPAGPIGVSGGP
jgi:hypothetical protein